MPNARGFTNLKMNNQSTDFVRHASAASAFKGGL